MVTRARQAWPATRRRLHARLLARRAATGASRGEQRRSAGRRGAFTGRALSREVRDCENDARRCPRRAWRGRTGCPRSCPRPWWWRGVSRATVVAGVGGRAVPLWTHMAIASSTTGAGWFRVGVGLGGLSKQKYFARDSAIFTRVVYLCGPQATDFPGGKIWAPAIRPRFWGVHDSRDLLSTVGDCGPAT